MALNYISISIPIVKMSHPVTTVSPERITKGQKTNAKNVFIGRLCSALSVIQGVFFVIKSRCAVARMARIKGQRKKLLCAYSIGCIRSILWTCLMACVHRGLSWYELASPL